MKKYNLFDEKVYEFDHESGLHVQLFSKKGFRRKYAAITVDFGSANLEYKYDGKIIKVPEGTAHFLEHKMFEKENGDMFNKYAKFGAQCNAYTDFSKTCYHFDCTENFDENLAVLFELVFEPYFTHASVEKEKGIIIQELKMYLDRPFFINYMELLKLMYKVNPIRNDIGGTEESVNSITEDILYTCYNAFYRPDNMCLTVVGDISIDQINQALAKAGLQDSSKMIPVEKMYPQEPIELANQKSVIKHDISTPLFMFGFKDIPSKYAGKERLKRVFASGIASELVMGQTTDFYEELYNSGEIYNIYGNYELEKNFGHFVIAGESERPDVVAEKVKKRISDMSQKGINSKEFEIFKKAFYGQQVRLCDRPYNLMNLMGQFYFLETDMFDYFDTCGKITEDIVNEMIKNLFSGEMAISVVEPKGGSNT